MPVDASTLVFFDASCLIAAAGRPVGGAGYVLSLCRRNLLRAAVSLPILLEAERNVRANLPPHALVTYRDLLAETAMIVVAVPDPSSREDYGPVVGEKDDHVLAAAIAAGAPFLLTLDKRLERRVNGAGLPIRTLAPGEFINEVLPDHADVRLLRK